MGAWKYQIYLISRVEHDISRQISHLFAVLTREISC